MVARDLKVSEPVVNSMEKALPELHIEIRSKMIS